jgi:hypothetical protein
VLEAALLRGKHKFAKKDEESLVTFLVDDATRGYNYNLPFS